MKFTPKVFLIAVLGFAGSPALTKAGLCSKRRDSGQCYLCYLSKPDLTTGDCGEVEEKDNCLMYISYTFTKKSFCQICKEGYSIALSPDLKSIICEKDDDYIKNCFDETSRGLKKCLLCKGGYPDFGDQMGECLPFGAEKNIDNCLIGLSSSPINISCFRCQDGYTYDYHVNKCLKSDSGCLSTFNFAEGKVCEGCNVFEGYSWGRDNKCHKVN